MKSRQFAAALWADDWEMILHEGDRCVQGAVIFDEDEGVRLDLPFGEVLKDPGVLVFGGEGLPDSLEWLYGFSQDGYRIALSDAHSLGTSRSFPGDPHQTVGAAQMLFSKDEFDPCDSVTAVILEVNGLAEWLGKSPIKRGRRQGTGPAQSFSIEVELDDGNRVETLHDGEDVSVCIRHGVTLSGPAELGVEIGHLCSLDIGFKRAFPLADAQDVAFRVADFFSFCFGFNAEIAGMALRFEGGAKADCLMPLVKGRAPDRIFAQRMVLPHLEVEESLDSMLGAWLADGDLKTPSSLLTSLLTKRWLLPANLKFIAAAQMLESLCRAGVDLRSMGDEDFEAFRAAVMAALDGIEDRRIARMAKQRIRPGNAKGQRRPLSEFVGRHGAVADYLFGDPDAFVSQHVYLRNGITHRNGEPAVGVVGLVWHTEGVLLLAYCAVGELLGLPDEKMTGRLRDSGFKSTVVRECRKAYASKASGADRAE